MKVIQCDKGHFYDSDKYDICPHCNPGAAAHNTTAPVQAAGSVIIDNSQSRAVFASAPAAEKTDNSMRTASEQISVSVSSSVESEPSITSTERRAPGGTVLLDPHIYDDDEPEVTPAPEPAVTGIHEQSADNTFARSWIDGGSSSPVSHERVDTSSEYTGRAPEKVTEFTARSSYEEEFIKQSVRSHQSAQQIQPVSYPQQAAVSQATYESSQPQNAQPAAQTQYTQAPSYAQPAVSSRPVMQPANDGRTMMVYATESEVEPVVGWLVGLSNNYYGVSFNLIEGRNFIGRGQDMDVVLADDPSVSRNRHAILIYDPSSRKFMLREGESKALIYVNNQMVMDFRELNNGDVIKLGNTRLRFVPLCGEDFSWDSIRKCPRCGSVVEPGLEFCGNCGTRIQ